MEKITEKITKFFSAGVISIHRSSYYREFPWRRQGVSPYEVLVSEVLLKRTTAAAVATKYNEFLEAFPTIHSLYVANLVDIENIIAPLGLVSQRISSLEKISAHICTKNNAEIPSNLQSLLEIPGIGDYAARAIMSFAFDVPEAIVDSNVVRVFNRFFGIANWSIKQYQSLADILLPPRQHRIYNYCLLDMGSAICKYISPICSSCPLDRYCNYYHSDNKEVKSLPEYSLLLIKKRKTLGISQVKLAKMSGVSKRTIVDIEKGRTKPTLATKQKIQSILDKHLIDE